MMMDDDDDDDEYVKMWHIISSVMNITEMLL